ncbi:MAG: hypothetical protein AAF449_02795 [Myxococcota bacterium]
MPVVSLRVLLFGCLFIIVIMTAGCRDRFECGVLLDGTATRCTGATEVCLCSERRCAKTAAEACPQSGYAYVFPEGDSNRCVPIDVLNGPVVSGNVTGNAALCPDQAPIPPRCGLRVSGQVASCPGNQTCLCEQNLCASFERTEDCPTGWRRAVDGACLDISSLNVNLRPGENGLCPGAEVPAPRVQCGRPNDIGLIEQCPDDQTCICSTNRCALADAVACPATRFRYAPDSPDAPAECVAVDDASDERISEGACAAFRPDPIACGSDALTSGPDCPEPGQVCVCGVSGGRCAEPAPTATCETGLRIVGSGLCVDPADQPTTIAAGLCAPTCGTQAADGRIVSCPFGTCLCGAEGGECAFSDPTCPSGSAFVADDRCVTYSSTVAAQPIAANEVCPAVVEDRVCGISGPDGRLARCGAGESCLCEGGAGRCIRPESTCPQGRAFVPTSRCAPADSASQQTVGNIMCPLAPAASAIACGELDDSGRIRACQTTEICVCRAAGGVCATAEPTCPFGFAEAHSGMCVGLSAADYTRPVSAAALCPARPPVAIACGSAAQLECPSDTQCGCRSNGSGGCVVSQAACPGGLAEAETLRCLPPQDTIRVVASGACPVGGN